MGAEERVRKRQHAGYADQRQDLLRRLRKIEGQTRGLQQMVADDRYCLDIVQQIDALTSAAREVAVRILESHLRSLIAGAGGHDDAAIAEMTRVLRKTLHARD